MSKKRRNHDNTLSPPAVGWEWSIPAWISCAAIFLVGILAYSGTFGSSFHFDDETSILNNPWIRNPANIGDVFSYGKTRFLTYFTFSLNYGLSGENVLGYHIVNLGVHLATALMVWLFVWQALRLPLVGDKRAAQAAPMISLIAALVFVAHPIQTQAVTYVAQRAASLATLFYVLTLYLYGEARKEELAGGSRATVFGYFAGAFVAGVLSAFSKETAFTLPVAILLYEIFFITGTTKIKWRYAIVVATILVAVPAYLVWQGKLELEVSGALPADEYMLTQPRVWLTYLRLFVLPINQVLDYDFPVSKSLLDLWTLLSFASVLALLYFTLRLYRKNRILSFGLVWFFLTLLPESSILPLPDVIFEHRMYLPMVGLSMLSVYAIFDFAREWKSTVPLALCVCIVGVLGAASYQRNEVWKDEYSLWSDVLSKTPGKPRAYLAMGRVISEKGRQSDALQYFNRAIAIDPSFADAYGNRANVLVQLGQPDAAIADCNRALALGSILKLQLSRIYFNRGTAYALKNLPDSAIADLTQTIYFDPYHATAYFNRGIAYSRKGDVQNAIADYTRSLELKPGNVKVLNNRGAIFKDLGRLDQALKDCSAAIAVQPDFPTAYLNRGVILEMKGQLDLALEDLNTFVRLKRDSPDGYFYRGRVLARKNENGSAIADLTRAIGINPSFGVAYVERARTSFALGDLKAAEKDLAEARKLGVTIDAATVAGMKKVKQ